MATNVEIRKLLEDLHAAMDNKKNGEELGAHLVVEILGVLLLQLNRLVEAVERLNKK